MNEVVDAGPLTDRPRWDRIYESGQVESDWRPKSPDEMALAAALLRATPFGAKRILEVGCGGSVYLPWLARRTGAYPIGIDYSPVGCLAAESRLRKAGLRGDILCVDILSPQEVPAADLVYSLGVVEHFRQVASILRRMAALVRPGGMMMTEVPNLTGLHGRLMRCWQPEVWREHVAWTPEALAEEHQAAGLEVIRACFLGIRSLGIVNWEDRPRWPLAARWARPVTARMFGMGVRWARHATGTGRWAAPYVLVVARKVA